MHNARGHSQGITKGQTRSRHGGVCSNNNPSSQDKKNTCINQCKKHILLTDGSLHHPNVLASCRNTRGRSSPVFLEARSCRRVRSSPAGPSSSRHIPPLRTWEVTHRSRGRPSSCVGSRTAEESRAAATEITIRKAFCGYGKRG